MPAVAISLAITAGGMALQYLLAPKIKQTPVDKGKLDDIRLQGSDYGAFIPRLLSGKARLAGNVVVSTGVDHYTVTTGGGGGKKRPQPLETTHTYKTSLAVLVARATVASFDKIWDGTELMNLGSGVGGVGYGYLQAESSTLSGGATSYVDATAIDGNAVQGLGAGGKATFTFASIGNPTRRRNDDPDELATAKTNIYVYYKCTADKLVDLKVTVAAVTTTYTTTLPNSNDEWTVTELVVDGFATGMVYEYAGAATANLDYLQVVKYWATSGEEQAYVSGAVNEGIAYPTDLDNPGGYYNKGIELLQNGTTGTYSVQSSVPEQQLRFYTGSEAQTQDAKIKSWLDVRYGAGEGDLRCSAMRGLAYLMIQDYTLKGGSMPNFTFEINKGTSTMNEALVLLFNDVNLTAGDYDITATAALSQFGLLEHTNQSRRAIIESLERYHFFRIGEIDGKIYTIPHSFTSLATITQELLRAHDSGESMPASDAEVIIREEHLLPREVRVSFMNPDLEYHNDAVAAQMFGSISGTESKEFSFPIIDTASQARNRAERLLIKEYNEDKAFEFWGMPELAKYAIGDVITVPIGGVNMTIRIEKKQLKLPHGKIRFQGVTVGLYDPPYTQDEVTGLAPKSGAQFAAGTYPRNSVVFAIPSQPIREADRGRLGVYLAISGRGRGSGEPTALYREMDEDNFVLQRPVTSSAWLGLCEDTLANWASGTGVLDSTNVLDIWFFNDITLETVTQTDIDRLPQINLIRVGSEWIQFRTATAQTLEDNSPYRSKWRISNLWRGRFGTSAAIATHVADEYAAVATPDLIFFDLEPDDSGETVSLKVVTSGQSIEVAPITSFTFTPVTAYTITNALADRTFDANNVTLHKLADVVATVIDDVNL